MTSLILLRKSNSAFAVTFFDVSDTALVVRFHALLVKKCKGREEFDVRIQKEECRIRKHSLCKRPIYY